MSAYSSLTEDLRPRFLCSGVLAHNAAPVIVTTYEGEGLAEGKAVPEGQKDALQEALDTLHSQNSVHGDVSRSMFVSKDGVVKLVNFDQTIFQPTPEDVIADEQDMQALLAKKDRLC